MNTEDDGRVLARAFYDLVHDDASSWDALPERLRQTEVGRLGDEYRVSRNPECREQAGCLLAGPNWYTALGRSF